ncbi:MAG: TonB-dependent receptor [Cyclobacteriaceae bacterium]
MYPRSVNPFRGLLLLTKLSRFNECNALRFCISMVAIFSATCGLSQSRIEGEVKADNGQPVPFANILLMNASDSTLAKGVVTTADGKFIMEDVIPGNFFIVGTMVGFKKTTAPVFTVSGQKNLSVTPLVMSEETVQLNEVTVEAEKAMFEQKVDRLVINVQNSITAAGNTVLEVLQKAPGITLNRQDNSIRMNGKTGVRIMMNGKIMQLPMDAVVQMLDGMSAANIQQIELITTPPAKYDAEGNSGIIHIVMKESADFGTSGTVGVTLGYKWAEVYGTNFNLQHRSKKAAYFLDYSFLRQRNLNILNMHRESVNDGFNQEFQI